jgi:glycosyltransferase involved in cell wall biosynthesis
MWQQSNIWMPWDWLNMNSKLPIRVMHVITDLNMGGAEMVLYHLLALQDRREFSAEVVSLTTSEPVGGMISNLGIPVHVFGMRAGVPDPRLVTRLRRLIQARRPHLIQTWMYHADLVGGLAARLAGSPPVVWGLHQTVTGRKALKPATYAVARLNAILSKTLPRKIVCCSEATRRTHVDLGYQPEKMVVISNGIDPDVFQPDPQARREIRRELGIDDRTLLIGLCARFHPQKDHRSFLQAAGILSQQFPDAHYVLWGKDVDAQNQDLWNWMREFEVQDRVHLLGLRMDSSRLMASLDIATLSSFLEAFPLVVGEAMACEIPCTVTNVGDSALIVGETGRVVPPRDPGALSEAWAALIQSGAQERQRLGAAARQRIVENFSLTKTVTAYESLYREVMVSI